MGLRSSTVVALALLFQFANATIFTHGTEFFCRNHDCYELLGLQFGASRREIKKAYRDLAIKNHPDKLPAGADREAAREKMNVITLANEVLGKSKSKAEYDAAYKDPKAFYAKQTTWWSRNIYAPRTNVWFSVLLFIASISAIQFHAQGNRYKQALQVFRKQDNVIAEANRILAERTGKTEEKKLKKRGSKKGKKSQKPKKTGSNTKADTTALEGILDELVEKLQTEGEVTGGYAKPSWDQTFAGFLIFRFPKLLLWYLRWFLKFTILRSQYGPEEKRYLTYLNMGISESKFEHDYTQEEQDALIGRELWLSENLEDYENEKKAAAQQDANRKFKNEKDYRRFLAKQKKKAEQSLGEYDDNPPSY